MTHIRCRSLLASNLFLLLLCASTAHAQLTTSLVACWPFQSDGNDFTANAEHLTSHGTPTFGAGKVGNATTVVSASGQFFDHTDDANLSVGDIDFAFAGWVNLTTTAADQVFIRKGNGAGLEYSVDFASGATQRFRFYVSSGSGFANLTSVDATTFGAPSTGTWYYLYVYHNATTNEIGISVNNGTANTAVYSAGSWDSGEAFYFAAATASPNADAGLDEWAMWKKVLSTQDKSDAYNGGTGLACSAFGGAAPSCPKTFSLLGVGC